MKNISEYFIIYANGFQAVEVSNKIKDSHNTNGVG